MTIRCALAAGLIATCALPSQAQVITQRDVGVRMGLAVAVGALDQCEKDGNSVSVAVVDRAGRLRVFLQSDQANPHNLELARRKAYTARTFGRTSAEWAKRTTEMPELAAQRELADVIALRGGVPIKVGNETIGAVGVSGSSSEGDEKCAMAGLAYFNWSATLARPTPATLAPDLGRGRVRRCALVKSSATGATRSRSRR